MTDEHLGSPHLPFIGWYIVVLHDFKGSRSSIAIPDIFTGITCGRTEQIEAFQKLVKGLRENKRSSSNISWV